MTEINSTTIKALQKELAGASAQQIIHFAAEHLEAPVFASSLGQEDQVITDLIAKKWI